MIWHSNKQANELERRIQHADSYDVANQTDADTLTPLVQLARSLAATPKKAVPLPHRTRAYAFVEKPEHIKTGLRLIRVSSYIGGATLVVGLTLTSVLAAGAHPGSPLYAYKLKSEQIRLHFTTSPESKLDLQLSFVASRIKDTQSALNNANIDTATKVAALRELTSQTKAAVETAREVAVAQKNPTLLDKIEELTQSQVQVLTQSSDNSNQEIGSDALAAAQENSKTIAATKLLVAASQDSDITNLPATTQNIKGTLSAVTPTYVVIDNVTVTLTDRTEVKYSKPDGKETKPELKTGQTVSITAVKNGTMLTAQNIAIVPTPGKVKSSTDVKNDGIIDTDNNAATTDVPAEVEKIQSGFQVENPAPLYPGNP